MIFFPFQDSLMRIQGSECRYAETKISTTRGAEGEGEPGVMRAADFGELVLLRDETAIRLAGQVRGRGVRFSVVLVLICRLVFAQSDCSFVNDPQREATEYPEILGKRYRWLKRRRGR